MPSLSRPFLGARSAAEAFASAREGSCPPGSNRPALTLVNRRCLRRIEFAELARLFEQSSNSFSDKRATIAEAMARPERLELPTF